MNSRIFRNNHVILFVLMFTMAVSSCNKNEDTIKQEQEKNYQLAKNPINELVQNPFDGEDEKVNMQLLNVAEDLRNAIDSKQLVLTSELNEMPIANLSNNFKSGAVKINYQGINYKSGITIINNETCDYSLDPIIAIGTDVYIGDSINGSYIAAMRKNNLGAWDDIIINEEQALAFTEPVVIINVLVSDYVNEEEHKLSSVEIEEKVSNLKSINAYTYKLNLTKTKLTQRFDNSKHSEFYISWNGGSAVDSYIHYHICDVHKKKINNEHATNFQFYYIDRAGIKMDYFINHETVNIYAATYERDWYASEKTVNVSGEIVPFKAKFSNEYYQKIHIEVVQGADSYIETFYETGYSKVEMSKY